MHTQDISKTDCSITTKKSTVRKIDMSKFKPKKQVKYECLITDQDSEKYIQIELNTNIYFLDYWNVYEN